MKKAFTPLMLALTVSLLAGCSDSSRDSGSVRFAVSASQALASDIARVSVTSSAADIPTVTVDLAATNGVWGGIIGNIPAGSNRSFLAQAFDSSGILLFEGSATGVTITANQSTLVAITLQQLHPPPPFDNEAPLIDSLVASSTSVAEGGSISLTATAHDPNPGDTLSYAWSATAGSFSAPSAAATSWTAPASTGIQTLTLTVTDSRGLSSSVVLAVNVTSGGEGDATLSISFNSSPVVAALSASPTYLAVGQTTSVSTSASDPDGDSLSYSWSASCAGTWAQASSRSAYFTPSVLPAGACNNCRLTVTVSDGRGGQNTGTVALCVSNTPPANHFNPVIIRSYRSSDTASPGQELTYEVVASDPEGSSLTFSWEANTGALGTPASDASHSRITWTAPSCVSTPPSITATVTNAFHLTATRTFTVTGLPACTGSWALTGSLEGPRSGHQAALLPDGKVLVMGGTRTDTEFLATAEVYDPATGTWSPTGSMADARWQHTATVLPDGKVLVVGGLDSTVFLATAEVYDPATGTWSPTGSMEDRRSGHTATLLPDGRVLVAGGISDIGGPLKVEVYDPATGTWSQTGSMAATRWAHTATLLSNGKVLVAGGAGPPAQETAEVYDPATGTWSPTGSMTEARFFHTATLLPDGRVLVTGGLDIFASALATAEVYDPATGTWSAVGSMVETRALHTATLLPDGKVLVVSGQVPQLYDPATNTWSPAGSLVEPRSDHSATLLPNGQVLIAGGWGSAGLRLATAELYTP
ncbi:kelch-like protein [Corallococcus praedator]|uniref:Kelch-like protein n=1 Tax=Corallococcus praedator TaxID=2316724 RepID=A0ABX9QMX3_9BACT|nr:MULTISPECIES: kelch repeat-containing protein [Corallococcus]RKH34578.1 kelch-like protein [Corallococcus sp. CA031C]RKI10990.1 kelch-like protein [Corallococcus praedator]